MAKTLDYKTMTLDDMKAYIEENSPEDKDWFKSVAITNKTVKVGGKNKKKPVYNHFKARKAFCEKYMPEIIPVAKEKEPTKAEELLNW